MLMALPQLFSSISPSNPKKPSSLSFSITHQPQFNPNPNPSLQTKKNPPQLIIAHELQSSAHSNSLQYGKQLHSIIFKLGLTHHFYLTSQILYMYVCCGQMYDAHTLFSSTDQPNLNLFFWNMMIRGYSIAGVHNQVIQFALQMLLHGFLPNNFTYPFVLKACAALLRLNFGRGVHGLAAKTGRFLSSDVFVATALLDMYGKCGVLGDACRVFDEMPVRNSVTWSSMIAAYAQAGCLDEAMDLICLMEEEAGEEVSMATWNSLVAGLVRNGNDELVFEFLRRMQVDSMKLSLTTVNSIAPVIVKGSSSLVRGKEVHAFVIRNGWDEEVSVCSMLVHMYLKNRRINDAIGLLENACVEKSEELWNQVITGILDTGQIIKAFEIIRKMLTREGERLNRTSLTLVLPECGVRTASEIHAFAIRNGLVNDVSVSNALMATYSKNGSLAASERIFHRMEMKDTVSWNTMVSCYARNMDYDQALVLFHQMHSEMISHDGFALSSALHTCGHFAAIRQGAAVHGHTIKRGFDEDYVVVNAAIDMYAKCGCVEDAEKLFHEMPVRDYVTWNTMISCYSVNRCSEKAFLFFDLMQEDGWKPTRVTFIAVLSACSHTGLVDEGLHIFNSMATDYGIHPDREHYACMVDALGRAGRLEEAFQMIKSMPMEADYCIWGALLSGCRIHGNVELAETAGRYLVELEPGNSGYYVLLANVYANKTRWEDVARVRGVMKDHGVKKFPGCSWIEVCNEVHSFVTWGKFHNQSQEIYGMLNLLNTEIHHLDDVHI